MNFEIVVTPEAVQTYNSLTAQLRQRWGDKFVNKLQTKISKCLDIIATSPYVYPVYDSNTELRRCVLHKNCSMLYKVINANILIICFWDNRQDPLFTL